MIHLKEITTEDMFEECLDLMVSEEQAEHVDDNAVSLALAWYHRDFCRPFCIYNDDTMVGFVMLYCDEAERECEIWQFMIDKKYQGKGYGKAALEVVIKHIKSNPVFENIFLLLFPDNEAAIKLYEKAGFYLTGESVDDEVVMMLAK